MSETVEMNLNPKIRALLRAQWFARARSERDAHHRFSSLANSLQQHPTLSVLCPALKEAAADDNSDGEWIADDLEDQEEDGRV